MFEYMYALNLYTYCRWHHSALSNVHDLIGALWCHRRDWLVHWHNGAYLSSDLMCRCQWVRRVGWKTGTEHYCSCTLCCMYVYIWSYFQLACSIECLKAWHTSNHWSLIARYYTGPTFQQECIRVAACLVGCITYCTYIRTYVCTFIWMYKQLLGVSIPSFHPWRCHKSHLHLCCLLVNASLRLQVVGRG